LCGVVAIALEPRNKFALTKYMALAERDVPLCLLQVLYQHFAIHRAPSTYYDIEIGPGLPLGLTKRPGSRRSKSAPCLLLLLLLLLTECFNRESL
jgi:hypothetical protein